MRINTQPKIRFVTSRSVFIISLIVISVTVLTVYITGIRIHRSILDNTLLSLTFTCISFFCFITYGLYSGIKLKDNVGDLRKNIKWVNSGDGSFPDFGSGGDGLNVGDGIEGILFAILFWILAAIAAIILIVLFGTILWASLMIFLGMLYWIFFRALRMVFKNSLKCKGDFFKSALYGVGYTTLYSFWIYGIIIIADWVK